MRLKLSKRNGRKWVLLMLTVMAVSFALVIANNQDSPPVEKMIGIRPSKTKSTIYTKEKVKAARLNINRYEWAKEERDRAVERAERYLKLGYVKLWEAVTAQSIPRSMAVNQQAGSPVTGRKIDEFGAYPYKFEPLEEPWKLVDPSSGYKFPTNDFEAYYRSGLDKNGTFSPDLADKRYLVNELYPEKGEKWGVDDGTGWVDDQGNKFTFIAYYAHWAVWDDFIRNALLSFRDAYLFTGQQKYADAGVVMLDRVADVYPQMDVSVFAKQDGFINNGGTGQGKILGSIWEAGLIRDFISCYDAFFPAMSSDKARFVAFLKGQGEKGKGGKLKQTAAGVKKNIEDGLLRQVFPAVKKTQIFGNAGFHQSALAMAAVVLDEKDTSREWIDFIFKPGSLTTENGRPVLTGGDLSALMVNEVDRDGYGDEASPEYNSYWLEHLRLVADILEGYSGAKGYDLYENPKFRKMFSSFIDIVMAGKFTPQIGDSGAVGDARIYARLSSVLKGFMKFGDPKFAQAAYRLNGNSFEGMHGTIFDDEPEAVAGRVKTIIEHSGELNASSVNLTGYGFAALVNGGSPAGADSVIPSFETSENNLQDVWMYYGRTGAAHSHKDALNIGIHAFGLDLTPDMGYVTFPTDNPLRMRWESNTVSHNTVVVDRKPQSPAWVGLPRLFDDNGRVKLMEIEAPFAYSQTEKYQRTTAMIYADPHNGYTVDFFRVKGGREHVFSFHGAESTVAAEGLRLVEQNGGTYAGAEVPYRDEAYSRSNTGGFNYLTDVSRDGRPPGRFSVDWSIADTRKLLKKPENIHLKLTMLGELNEVALAVGQPPQNKPGNPDKLHFLLAKRTGSNLSSVFTSVIEPYRNESFIRSVQLADVTRNRKTVDGMEARALRVELKSGRVDYIISATQPDVSYLIDGRILFKGAFGVYSENDNVPEYGYVNGGTTIGELKNPFVQTAGGVVSGTVVEFTRSLADSNQITIRLERPLGEELESLVGRMIYVDNDYLRLAPNQARNAVYPIKGVKAEGNRIVIDIGNVTLIRGWKNPNDTSQGYRYDIQPGNKITIPLPVQKYRFS